MSSEKIILNYNDSLLHDSDLELLEPSQWLNDRLLGFVYEYFELDLYAETVCQRKICLVNPSTVQFLKLITSMDEARMCFFEPLELDKRNKIVFPLNNNKSNSCGGSHWSLLVLNRCTSTFTHYDSFMGSNAAEAEEFFNKFKFYFKADKLINDEQFPQQQNTSDCGVYVLGK